MKLGAGSFESKLLLLLVDLGIGHVADGVIEVENALGAVLEGVLEH